MKKIIITIFFISTSLFCKAQFYKGVGLGLNSVTLEDDEISIESKIGWNGGIMAGYDFKVPITIHSSFNVVRTPIKISVKSGNIDEFLETHMFSFQQSAQVRYRLPSEIQPSSTFVGVGVFIARGSIDGNSFAERGILGSFGFKVDQFSFEIGVQNYMESEASNSAIMILAYYVF